MKNWWLNLYTIPMMKKLGTAFALIIGLTLLMAWQAPSMIFFMCMGSLYVAFVVKKNTQSFLSNNIEFHKLHVPLNELKKAFLLDAIILFFFQMAGYLVIHSLIYTFSTDQDGEVSYVYLIINFFSALNPFYGLAGFKKGAKPVYEVIDTQVYKVSNFFITSFFVVVILIGSLLLIGFNFSFASPVILFGGGFILSYMFYIIKAVFHQEMAKGTPFVCMKYSFQGMAVSLIGCFLLSFLMRPIVHSSLFPADIRYFAFSFSGPFAEELDVNEAKVLLKVADLQYDLVIQKTAGIDQLPVSELFDKPTAEQYFKYVKSVNPSKENMIYILTHLSKIEKDPLYTNGVNAVIVKKWPKGEKFPEHLLQEDIKRAVASVRTKRANAKPREKIIPTENSNENSEGILGTVLVEEPKEQ